MERQVVSMGGPELCVSSYPCDSESPKVLATSATAGKDLSAAHLMLISPFHAFRQCLVPGSDQSWLQTAG